MREAGFIAQDCELEDSVQAGRGTVLSGVKADAHVRIEPGARLTQCHLAEFSNVGTGVLLHDVSLGRFSYIAERSRLNQVRLGGFCSIGPECMFGFGRHPVDRLSTHPIIYSSSPPVATSWLEESTFLERAPITVGHDVFIGARVFIADGVKVGEGAVIGAGAIVTKDVAPYEVVGGVPAKRIKMRFSDSDIEELGQLAWWFWPVEVLKEARPLLDQHEPRLLVEFARAQGLIPTSRSNP